MFGLSSSGKDSIAASIEKMFDTLALRLLGEIPKLRDKKYLLFSMTPKISLTNIFLQAMDNKTPNHLERDALKSMLDSAHGYVESLKSKTKSNIVESVDALVKEAKINGRQVSSTEVSEILSSEMGKAQNSLNTIAEAETTKTRNVGHTMDIAKVAERAGDDDPTVFFVIVRDGEACSDCVKMHMMPDKVTPRLWKLKDLSAGWYKRGDEKPSICGLHPFCRCSETFLPKGFGFVGGFIHWVGLDYDAYAEQQKNS